MKQSTLDKAFFLKKTPGGLCGIIGIHVDDFFWCGDSQFITTVIQPLRNQFLLGSEVENDFLFLGLNIECISGQEIRLSQKTYIDRLDASKWMNKSRDLKTVKSLMGSLDWVASQTQPEMSFDVHSLLTMASESIDESIARGLKLVRKVKYSANYAIRFPPLFNPSTWSIFVYSDASFANSTKSGTQGGFIILLVDENKSCCPLAWQSKRLNRVVHSTLAAETLALVLAVDNAIFLQKKVFELLDISPKIICFTDNKSLESAIKSTKPVKEKRLRIDIASLAESIERREIAAINWLDSKFQLANSLTKQNCPDKLLSQILQDGILHIPA